MPELKLDHQITQEAMNRFATMGRAGSDAGPGVVNHHTDPEIARAAGLDGTVAQALHYCAYISHLMLEEHGEAWLEGGEMEMVFIHPVYADDTVTVAIDDPADGDKSVVNCTNQDGTLLGTGQVTTGH